MKRALLLTLVLVLAVGMVLTGCSSPSQSSAPAESSAPASESAAPADSESAAPADSESAAPAESRSAFSTDLMAIDADPTAVDPSLLPVSGLGPQVTSDVKAKESYKIAIIVKNTTNPFLLKSITGAEKAAADMGFECISLAPATQDSLEDQVKLIEDAITQGVQGIILHVIDSNGIMPAIRKCDEAGIPVACIGTPAANETFMRTGVDYTETGETITKMVAEKIGGKGKLIILEGPPGAQNAQERLAGIHKALESYPDIEVVASQTTNFKRTEGMQVTENLLQKYPDVSAIIGCNDESSLGAIQALKAAGLDGKVIVGSFDGNQDGSAAIKDGEMYVTYDTDPYGSTYLAAAYIVQFLNDGTMPPKYFVPYPSVLQNPVITSDNIDSYIADYAWWKE